MRTAITLIALFLLIPAVVMAGPVSLSCDDTKVAGGGMFTCGGDIANYEESPGVWREVDLAATDASCPGSFTHCYSKNRLKAYIDAANGIVAVGIDKDHYLELRAHPVNPVAVSVEPVNKHTVQVSKDTASVHYNFYITQEGLKTKFELLDSSVPDTFALGFRLVGLTRQGRDIYKDGEPVASLPNPYIIDSSGVIIPVFETIEEPSGTVYLSFNKASITAWPAVLDPSLTIDPSTKDSYMDSTSVNANNGSATDLYCGSNGRFRPIFHFDFSPLDDGVTITEVLFYASTSGGACQTWGATHTVRRITDDSWDSWTESGVTHNCARDDDLDGDCAEGSDVDWEVDGAEQTTTDQASESYFAGRMSWDVTNMTITAQSSQNEQLNIVMHTDCPYGGNTFIRSKEYATPDDRPKLTITYSAGGSVLNFDRGIGRGIGRGIR